MMNAWLCRVWLVPSLLAQRNPLDRMVDNMGSGFRHRQAKPDGPSLVAVLLAVLAVLVALWAIGRLWQLAARRLRHSPLWVFGRLCRAHRLGWKETWLLWRLARQHGLRDPALVFVQPERFETSKLPARWGARAGRWGGLRGRLFAEYRRSPGAVCSSSLSRNTPPGGTRLSNCKRH